MNIKQPVGILIVEDAILTARAIESALKNFGYEIVGFARSGQEAIETATRARPDVVLMDIQLEGLMDGVSATHRIQTILDIPVIYLTASSDPGTIRRALHSSPYGYITKPFKEQDLHDAIENALARKKVKKEINR